MDPLEIIESTAEPAFATDESFRVVIWNTAAERLLGFRPEDVLGRSCYDVICGRDSFGNRFCDENCNVVGMIRRRESINRFSLLIRCADGGSRPVWVTIISVPGPKKFQCTIIHILGAVGDPAGPGVVDRGDSPGLVQRGPVGAGVAGVASATEAPEPAPPVLTSREQEVLSLMAEGTGTAEIADSLFISISTVRSHTQSILGKLDAHSKLEAVAIALRKRLI